jgi:flagellar basal-body rod modification protein FlgD
MATYINPISSPSAAVDTTTTAAKANSNLAPDKETFLQLLVAQIKNQNPLNPSDGAEFVAQLAQFSQLEQSMAIKQDVETIRDALAALASATQSGTAAKPSAGDQAKGVN